MRKRLLTGLAVAAAVVAAEPAQAQCPVGFTQVFYAATFGCYGLTPSQGNWIAANATATAAGGFLAAIESAAENTAIRSFVTGLIGGSSAWIGFNDQATEGTFVWSNGQPVTFTNWNGGEPNNAGNEDFTELQGSGGWNDLGAGNQARGVMEIAPLATVPEPATVALLGSGLLALGAVVRQRRRG